MFFTLLFTGNQAHAKVFTVSLNNKVLYVTSSESGFSIKGLPKASAKDVRVIARALEGRVSSSNPVKRFFINLSGSKYEVFIFDGNVYSIYKDGKILR